MRRLSRVALQAFPLYLVLLVVLAIFAETNQQRALLHLTLIRERTNVLEQLAIQRTNTARVTGPLAITQWATERGMIAAPNQTITRSAEPLAAPDRPGILERIQEVRTVWR